MLEAEQMVGSVTSSRNSGVVHAGIYYPQGSLKAWACVEGRNRLYDFCREHGVPHRRCGKLIVATEHEQLPTLAALAARAEANGVAGDDALRVLSADEACALEPALRCVGALLSPATGIVDTHALMLALQGDAEAHGAVVALGSPVVGARALPQRGGGGSLLVETDDMALECDELVNCAGLAAPALARRVGGVPASSVPPARYAKGNYYALQGASPFERLVYPVPEEAGLGVHATVDLAGRCRFGPDVEWLEAAEVGALDYAVDPARAESFYAEVRKYWPALPDGALVPDYAGVRPKVHARGEPAGDFMVRAERHHGVRGLVNMFGVESPGLTASLALAAYVESEEVLGARRR